MATCTVRAVVEGNDVELVWVQVMALLREPLADGAVGFTIGAGHMAEVVYNVMRAHHVDASRMHGGTLR